MKYLLEFLKTWFQNIKKAQEDVNEILFCGYERKTNEKS